MKAMDDNNRESLARESLAEEMQAVKRLLILQALALGCQQKHVAAALGVSDATLSRMFPKGFASEMAKIAAAAAARRRDND